MYMTKEDFPIDVEHQSLEIPDSNGARQSTLMSEGVLLEYAFEDAKTVAEAIRRGHKVSNDGPCLGWRDTDSEYKWINYSEVIERSQNISYGLVHAGMKSGPESFLGIYAQNCVEWVLVEHACYTQSAVVVPLYDTLGPQACTFILNHVEAEFLFCDTQKKAKGILDVKHDIPKLQHIILIEEVGEELKALAAEKSVTLHQLKDIEESGRQKPGSLILPKPSDLATICYTSGTTGDPKGVMLTHCNMISCASGFIKHLGINYIGPGDRHMSYLPLAHMLDRESHVILFSTGGAVGFSRGDVKLLAEDISAMKPTMFPAVPRVLNRIYDKVMNEVNSNPMKKFLFDMAQRSKQADLENGIIRNNSLWDRLVLKKVRDVLGGKVRLLVVGGAPIRDEVLSFFRCCLGCPIVQAYGQTESTAGCNCSIIGEYRVGNVGPPLPSSFVKLMDVPDMGYETKNGEGEVLVKGPSVTKGYFKDPLKTAEILDEEGWLHTGDIGRWVEKGVLSIIDRKKNLLKLSQGEYISPEKVEAVYMGCPYVEQIFVHGDSLESCLVAVIVPEKEALLSWCSQQKIEGGWDQICGNEDVKVFVLKELNHLGVKSGLKGFEQVKAIYLHPDGFSQQNGLLTVTLKLKRLECRKQFKKILQKMYDDMR